MALYRHGAFVDDDWQFPADGDPLPAAGKVAVGKARLLAAWHALRARNAGAGVVLAAGETLSGLEEIIPRLSLVTLDVAKYSDGRHFSVARLLRERYGYRGELRATGEVLQDQVGFFLRTGFDALDISHAGTVAALRGGRIRFVRHHYQPASNERAEMRTGRRSWLRLSETM